MIGFTYRRARCPLSRICKHALGTCLQFRLTRVGTRIAAFANGMVCQDAALQWREGAMRFTPD